MNTHEPRDFQMVSAKMSEDRNNGERSWQRIETAIRLILLAVPGLLIVMFCWLALIIEFSYGEPLLMNPLVAAFLTLVGSLMIVGGTKQWRRWGYLWVFLSIPIVALIWASLSPFLTNGPYDPLRMHPKLLGMTIFVFPMIVSFAIVSRYYAWKAGNSK